MEQPPYLLVITTCPNSTEAHRLTTKLLSSRLAACVQSNPIESTYHWQGKIETTQEIRLLIKARAADYTAIEALIQATHAYETPQVIAIPIQAGSAPYLAWLEAETSKV